MIYVSRVTLCESSSYMLLTNIINCIEIPQESYAHCEISLFTFNFQKFEKNTFSNIFGNIRLK